jgi:hypothetical protein
VAVESSNLPVNMTAAEQAQLLRSLAQMQERAINQAAAGRSQDQGKADTSDLVRGTGEINGATIQGESRGAHSFTLKKDEENPKEDKPAEPRTPDPDGRGEKLDIEL